MTASPKVDVAKQASSQAAKPPFITATFAGTFYKKIGKGYDYVNFTKTVKLPYSAVVNKDYTPVGLFHRYKKAKLMADLGGVDLRYIYLQSVEGELPPIKSQLHKLLWMADRTALVDFANDIGEVPFIHVDLKTNERESKTVSLDPNLYPDTEKLRHAIRTLITEPEAFDREQDKLAKKDAAVPKHMEAEIAALADDE